MNGLWVFNSTGAGISMGAVVAIAVPIFIVLRKRKNKL